MSKQQIVIFDIDGTLANIDHRREYLDTKNGTRKADWKSFNLERNVEQDSPYEDIIELNNMLNLKYEIAIVTGRMENQREVTERWLEQHGIKYEIMLMRPNGDYSQDWEVKRRILFQLRELGYEPRFVFDDRDQVVDMWRENGVRCLQVALGDF